MDAYGDMHQSSKAIQREHFLIPNVEELSYYSILDLSLSFYQIYFKEVLATWINNFPISHQDCVWQIRRIKRNNLLSKNFYRYIISRNT